MPKQVITVDTAIIGGGATGLFTCLKLHQKVPGSSIALFESSNRFGGRIETAEMDGFLAEYGPMRFERKAQPLLMGLIKELGLETMPFAPYMAENAPETLFDLKANRPAVPGSTQGGLCNALDLLALGVLRLLGHSPGDMNDPHDPRHWQWWASLDEPYYRFVRAEAAYGGAPLWRMGFWNALSRVLGHEAIEHILRFGTFYHVVHYNPGAAEWIIFWLRGLHPGDELVGVSQGTQAITDTLAERLSALPDDQVSLRLSHALTGLSPEPDGRVRLTLRACGGEDVAVLARHAVLAIPWSPLKYLRGMLPGRVAQLTDSVIPIPLVKCFFVTRSPWWDSSTPPQTRAAATPTRELHYACRGEGSQRRGMAMVYGEPPTMHYWRHFVTREPHMEAELNGDPRLLDQYLQYLGDRSRPDTPGELKAQKDAVTAFGIRDWSREPFEAGCHIWKPGVRVEEAIEELTAFSLSGDPGAPRNVHICGEAYSDFQGFIEGGLRTALTVIGKITG